MYSGIPFPKHIFHWGKSPTNRFSMVSDEITKTRQGPLKERHSLGAFLAYVPFQIFPYATAQSLGSGSHAQRFSSQCRRVPSIALGEWRYYKSEGQGLSLGSSFITHFPPANLLPAMHLVFTVSASTKLKPKASAYPQRARGCFLVVPSLSYYGTRHPLHTFTSVFQDNISYNFFTVESRVELWFTFLESSLYSFELTF